MTLSPVRLLLLLAAGASLGLASLWLDQQGYLRNIAWTAPAAKLPDLQTPVSQMPAADGAALSFASIQERPLFAPDRRPPPPPPPPAPPDPFATIALHGVFTGTNAGILARVDGKVRRIKLNETVGEWTLKSIDGRQVTFAKGDQTRQLQLVYAKLNTVTPPPLASSGTKPPVGPSNGAPASKPDHAMAYREERRKQNELRASRGLPLLPD